MKRFLWVSVSVVGLLGGTYFGAPLLMTKVHVAVQTEETPAVVQDVLGEAERRALAEASGTVQQDAPQGRYLSLSGSSGRSPAALFGTGEK